MFTTSYSVSHRSLSEFVSIIVQNFSGAFSVQMPTHLYSRADGQVTVRAANPDNTRTFDPTSANITGIRGDGSTVVLRSTGPERKVQGDPINLVGNYTTDERLRYESAMRESVALLDRFAPDWFNRVNLDTLDMMSSTDCVLGQVFANQGSNGWMHGLRLFRQVVPNFDDVAFANWHETWVAVIRHRRGL